MVFGTKLNAYLAGTKLNEYLSKLNGMKFKRNDINRNRMLKEWKWTMRAESWRKSLEFECNLMNSNATLMKLGGKTKSQYNDLFACSCNTGFCHNKVHKELSLQHTCFSRYALLNALHPTWNRTNFQKSYIRHSPDKIDETAKDHK